MKSVLEGCNWKNIKLNTIFFLDLCAKLYIIPDVFIYLIVFFFIHNINELNQRI